MGMAANLVMALCDAAVAVLLYRVFLSVEPTLSLMAMVFRLVQATIIGLNLGAMGLALGFASNSADLSSIAGGRALHRGCRVSLRNAASAVASGLVNRIHSCLLNSFPRRALFLRMDAFVAVLKCKHG